jgi:hypothetical protein
MKFPYEITKFRVNSTPDCYDTQVASSAWHFYGTLLPSDRIGLAQLSNRLLVPPDGLTFTGVNGLIGNAWLALPLIPAYTAPTGLAVGNQSWTLFFRAANFSGPVAFFTPEVWTRVHLNDATARGTTHDVRPMTAGGVAIELGGLPYFEGSGPDGILYRRVPKLSFPESSPGQSVVQQDVRFYSKTAIWNATQTWLDAGTVATQFDPSGASAPAITHSDMSVRFGSESVVFPSSYYVGAVTTAGGQPAFGLKWTGDMPAGSHPEYYRKSGVTWVAVPPSEVPRTTWLVDQSFPTHAKTSFPTPSTAAGSPFSSSGWAAGPFTVTLADGSKVDYAWYKFTDQPAIARLGLAAPVLAKLQAFVESLHENSGISMAAPSSGTLATLDAALIVTAPTGFAKGYVPVVIRQY